MSGLVGVPANMEGHLIRSCLFTDSYGVMTVVMFESIVFYVAQKIARFIFKAN